jgi:hypothetical protein
MGSKRIKMTNEPESKVEHEIHLSPTSEAGQLPADPHDMKHSDSDPSESVAP